MIWPSEETQVTHKAVKALAVHATPEVKRKKMKVVFAKDAIVGELYHSGPDKHIVRVERVEKDRVNLSVHVRFYGWQELAVPASHLLTEIDKNEKETIKMKTQNKQGVVKAAAKGGERKRDSSSMSFLIDSLIEKGDQTIGMMTETIEKAFPSAKTTGDGYTPRYIYSRMFYLKKHGREVVRDGKGADTHLYFKGGKCIKPAVSKPEAKAPAKPKAKKAVKKAAKK